MGVHILWGVVIGFLAGVFLRSFTPLGLSFVLFLTLVAIALLLIGISTRRGAQSVIVAAILLACGVGILRMDIAVFAPDPELMKKIGEKVEIEGIVFNEPDVREASVRVPIRLEDGSGVLVVAAAHAAVSYGDVVRAKGTLRLPKAFSTSQTGETGEGREFNYPAYLAKEGISFELSFASLEVSGRGAANPLKTAAIYLKHKFLEGLSLGLPEPHAGLAGGITVGDKRGLGDDLADVFRTVGLTHIVVLSGYNIMIVMEALSRSLVWFRASRYVHLGATLFIAIFFALMTGLASASVRAAAMATIAVLGRFSGRMYLASRALAVVAAGMVLSNPYILAFDPGFQLSVLATGGLIAFTPKVVTKLRFVPEKFGLREIAATTIGTQIAVLPLLLYQNGQLPLYSLPANLLALIAVPWAMLFATIAAVAGLILGPFATVVAFPAYGLLSYVIAVADVLAHVPYASLAIPAFSAWWLVPVYAVMVLCALYGRAGKIGGAAEEPERAIGRFGGKKKEDGA